MKKSTSEGLLDTMGSTLVLARITGAMMVISYLVAAQPISNLINL
jgi:hypothetical protein